MHERFVAGNVLRGAWNWPVLGSVECNFHQGVQVIRCPCVHHVRRIIQHMRWWYLHVMTNYIIILILLWAIIERQLPSIIIYYCQKYKCVHKIMWQYDVHVFTKFPPGCAQYHVALRCPCVHHVHRITQHMRWWYLITNYNNYYRP